jgi:hypothetical protein
MREELSNPDQLALPQSAGGHEIRVSPEGRSRSRGGRNSVESRGGPRQVVEE